MVLRITDKQVGMLQSLYARLKKDDDPRTWGPAAQRFAGDEREARLAWARAQLGNAKLASFTDLNVSEACYLIDRLQGKRTKLDLKLEELIAAQQPPIQDREGWFAAFQLGKSKWVFRGSNLNQLNRYQIRRLIEILEPRAPSWPPRYPAPEKPVEAKLF